MEGAADSFEARVVRHLEPHLPGLVARDAAGLDDLARALARFCGVLRAANERINLTGITDAQGMAVRHVVDSLLALPALEGSGPLLDLGSGGGVPGLPLALALPERPVVLVESRLRKSEALAGMVDTLALGPRVSVVHARAEAWLAHHAVDTIVTRALGSVGAQLELLHPLRSSFRRLVMLKGPAGDAELAAVADQFPGWGQAAPERLTASLPDGAGERLLLVFDGGA